MKATFRLKLLATHVGLVTAVLLLLVFELDRTLGGDLVRQLDDRLEQQAQGAAQWVSEGRRHPDKLAGRLGLIVHAQVTIFERDGAVLGDSVVVDVATAPPGTGDPIFEAARRGEIGRATRVVDGAPFRFVAVPASDGMVLRLGAPLADIDATLGALRKRLAVAFGLGVLAALGLGWLASQLASRPLRQMTESADRIARGDYAITPSRSPDEFGVLSRTLASLAAQLETQLGELTAERDHVRRLLVVRRDFIANVSHELRTPITAVQGYAETLLEGRRVDEATQREFLEIVHRHARRMGALVEALLTLSELEARPPEKTVHERVDLADIAQHVRATLRDRASAADTTVDVEVPADLAALGDPVGLEQILENLVDNAIKYGRRAGTPGRVRVRGERAGDRAVITVSDDGAGIAAEHLPRLFERFYRVDPGRSRDQGGTGLGLAIVKHLADGMGGSVEAKSEVGVGTTLRVELPAWTARA